ncbi:Hypothetical Protein FCC1311_009902 [Hondaea fermentalgiana]|uniref:Uncharacterized protein n=1 Tax=Hondaea fermentalgiana TaxID=2315210 RepID=A0A2R5G197_9STRA|nr:Hypothetical Protein FCC1311_009902 [Hondaea fermentalgiana]|eukprot:GBG24772.1 Hypothetical Protein FCC1311_009902 [Hondaea fermentalgiana]
MSSVRDRIARLEATATPLTPEAQERKLREERDKQRQAVKIAKARAARYNMTLRALSIKSVREQTEAQRKDRAAVREAQERAKKYNMTSRALALVATKNQRNVARAFDSSVSPETAKQIIRAVATHQASTAAAVNDPNATEKQQLAAAAKALKVSELVEQVIEEEDDEEEEEEEEEVQEAEEDEEEEEEAAVEEDEQTAEAEAHEEEVEVVEEEEEEEETEDEEEEDEIEEEEEEAGVTEVEEEDDDEEDGFVDEDLADAVMSKDDDAVNRAILKQFLETHAPHRVDEVDALMAEYAGRDISELFDELNETYPDPAEAQVEGEQRALQEAMNGKIDADDADEDNEAEQDDEEELSTVEQARRDAEAAERREKAKIAAMTEAEREAYFEEKELEREHSEHKDAMLRRQLDLYSKGGSKENPVLARMRGATTTKRAISKRISKRLSVAEDAEDEAAVDSDGFILGASSASSHPRSSARLNRGSVGGGAKWAVNVQPQLLRERMKRAGVADEDIDNLMSEESDML